MQTDRVSEALIAVFDRVVLPRYGRLAGADVEAKAPGDLVTIADREAEAELTAWLRREDPAARVVGEEAVAADPALRAAFDAPGRLWVIDPVDGTGNFVAGNDRFGCLIAELVDGRPVRSWIWQGPQRRLFVTERGRGVRVEDRPGAGPGQQGDGRRIDGAVTVRRLPGVSGEEAAGGRELIGSAASAFAGLRGQGLAPPLPTARACVVDYAMLALGERDYVIHSGKQPWDHWPGVLLLAELGGRVGFLGGADYTSNNDEPPYVLSARTPQVWDAVASAVAASGWG